MVNEVELFESTALRMKEKLLTVNFILILIQYLNDTSVTQN